MTPDEAVQYLADILVANPEASQDDVYMILHRAGLGSDAADRAWKFTQIAWGRTLLDGMGVRFSDDYYCFDAGGQIVEQGLLKEEAYFAAAVRHAPKYGGTPAFERLALTSADVQAVNNSLHAGSRPEDLIATPACIFLEMPTSEGIRKAQAFLERQAAELGARPQKKSWWEFWK